MPQVLGRSATIALFERVPVISGNIHFPRILHLVRTDHPSQDYRVCCDRKELSSRRDLLPDPRSRIPAAVLKFVVLTPPDNPHQTIPPADPQTESARPEVCIAGQDREVLISVALE
jgi:hypothetical protein